MDDSNRRTRRRWFQLSLRSIFLLMLVVAAYFAGYRTAARQAEQAQQADREARPEAERSAAEAKLAEERARQVFAYMQVVATANAALVQAKKSAALAEIDAALQLQEKKRDHEDKPESVEPKQK